MYIYTCMYIYTYVHVYIHSETPTVIFFSSTLHGDERVAPPTPILFLARQHTKVYTYMYIYICTYVYICIFIYIYTHIHAFRNSNGLFQRHAARRRACRPHHHDWICDMAAPDVQVKFLKSLLATQLAIRNEYRIDITRNFSDMAALDVHVQFLKSLLATQLAIRNEYRID